MSCNTCNKQFGLFTKEYGCPNCGFCFCGKCLKWSVFVPKLAKTKKVCTSCYEALNNLSKKPVTSHAPAPEALQKRMDALASKGSTASSSETTGTSNGQQVEEIERRLQLLRQDTKELIPVEADIEDRLAKLKGVDVSVYRKAPITVYKDKRSVAEKASDLIKQAQSEVQLDARREESIKKGTQEIEQRLNTLRGVQQPQDKKPVTESKDSIKGLAEPQCEDGETADADVDDVARLIEGEMKAAKRELENLKKDKQLMAELKKLNFREKGENRIEGEGKRDEDIEENEANAVLVQVLDKAKLEDEEMEGELEDSQGGERQEELPWCVLCNADATLRCHDCTDLYCRNCYREYHEGEDHRTSNFSR